MGAARPAARNEFVARLCLKLAIAVALVEPMSGTEEFAVGARCYCEGFYATIRFVGEVPPAKGGSVHQME